MFWLTTALGYSPLGWDVIAADREDMVLEAGGWLVLQYPYSASREQTGNGFQGPPSVAYFLQ